MFDVIGRYFWLLCIGITVFNFRKTSYADAGRSSRTFGAVDTNEVLRRRALLAQIAPWLVMGWGILIGRIPSVWSYFRPQDRNPYVWAWYASMFVLACVVTYWVIFRDGAKKALELRLVKLAGPRGEIHLSEFWVKVIAALGPLWIVVWIWFASTIDAPLPK